MKVSASLKGKLIAIAFQFAIGGSTDLNALADTLEALAQECRAESTNQQP